MMAYDTRGTREIKCRIAMAREAFSKEILFTNRRDLHLRKKLYIAPSGAKLSLVLKLGHWKVDQKHLKSF
jgi:hypothetical protein